MTEKQQSEILRLLESQKKSTGDRAWDIATKLMVPAVLGGAVWLIGLQVRVSVIESGRFTASDGQELEKRVMAAFPPSWLREDITEIKERLKRLEERVR